MENNSEIKEISSVERELTITVPGESITDELNRAYQRMSQKVRLKGFRPQGLLRFGTILQPMWNRKFWNVCCRAPTRRPFRPRTAAVAQPGSTPSTAHSRPGFLLHREG